MKTLTVTARYVSGSQTYMAGPLRGQRATSTGSAEQAARRLVGKLYAAGQVRAVCSLPSNDLFTEHFEFTIADAGADPQ